MINTTSVVIPNYELTHHRARELLHYDADSGNFTWLKRDLSFPGAVQWNAKHAGKKAGGKGPGGYLVVRILSRRYYLHQIAWLIHHGERAAEIDHINHNRQDNRIVNLRSVDRVANMKNASMRSDNTSGFTGVCWNKELNKWQAKIRINDRTVHLGVFTCIEDAIAVRQAANFDNGFHINHGVAPCK